MNTWVDRLRMHTLRWLVRGPGTTYMLAGTLAWAGFGAAALNAPAGASVQVHPTPTAISTLLASYKGCWADPDGDGHIFCNGTVSIASLPAAFGYCFADSDGENYIICLGQDR